jgi:PPP family 3-phenylpropionic acid transporter
MLAGLGAFYFLVFAYIGILAPWFAPFLADRGLSDASIGLALAAVQLPRVVLPPLWGFAADRIRETRRILALAAVLAGAAFVAVVPAPSQAILLIALLVHGALVVPVFPLAEAQTFEMLGSRRDRYGQIRLWGSVGFIVSSLGIGSLLDVVPGGVKMVPWAVALTLGLAGLVALTFRPTESRADARTDARASGRQRWPSAAIVPVLVATALGQASHGAYYAFFSLQLDSRGVHPVLIGALWAWAVVAEILLMAFSPRILGALGLVFALRLALVLTVVRWVLCAAEPSVWWLFVPQTLHAASFALLHLSTVRLADAFSPRGGKALGQSFASAAGYGLGLGGGMFLAGRLSRVLDDGELYVASAGLALVGVGAAAFVSMQRRYHESQDSTGDSA